MVVVLVVPLPEALGSRRCPWEIVTDDASLGGNVGASGFGSGGGWEIKNARCRKMEDMRCKKHDDLVKGQVRW